jgi:hypothetical protein
MNYLINRGGQQFGPYPLADIHNMLAQGQIAPNDLAWCEGMPSWAPVAQVLAQQPSPQQYPPPQQYAPAPTHQAGTPFLNDWLQRVQARLTADRYEFLPNPASYTGSFQLAARRSRFQLSKFGNYETFFVFSNLGVPDIGTMTAFSTAAFDYAKRNKKSGLPCGLFEAVACFCVAIVGAAPQDLVYSIRGNTPAKHWSAFEIPVVFDASQGQLHYLEKTPAWGAAYWRGFRKEIEKYLR